MKKLYYKQITKYYNDIELKIIINKKNIQK